MDFNKLFMKSFVNDIKKIDYNFEIFEADDKIKNELTELINEDKDFYTLKNNAIKDKDAVINFIDYLNMAYCTKIESIADKHKLSYDHILNTMMEL